MIRSKSFSISRLNLALYRKMSSNEPEAIISVVNSCGVITLNRPKVLNALNLNMVRIIYPQMKAWAKDSNISHVMIQAAGEKAFCAGGDITAVVKAAANKDVHACDFFREEYKLNNLIGTYPKPYIAIIDGITMGGGVGLSVHGKYRVATERTLFAMPETAIGLFPDVGGGYFLPRIVNPGLGLYLALTGVRLKGMDVLWCGVATHFTPVTQLERLKTQLTNLQINNQNSADDQVQGCLIDHHSSAGFVEPKISQYSHLITSFFDLAILPETDPVQWICDELRQMVDSTDKDGDWARMTLQTLEKMSPLSLKITARQLQQGAKMRNLEQVLQMEFRLSQNCLLHGDFPEGVRALIIDKDNKPAWKPNRLEGVTPEMVDRFFNHLEIGPEWSLDD